jgi:DNA-binding NarL/FixJ family response regulator
MSTTAVLKRDRGPTRILAIDDQPLVREMLAHLVIQLGSKVELIEADNLAAATDQLTNGPDFALAIVELALPDAAGVGNVERLRTARGDLPVVVLTAQDDAATARAALAAGARGFISKRSPTRVVAEAIRLVLVGGTYLPPQALESDLTPAALPAPRTDPNSHAYAAGGSFGLTPRQLDVLALLVQGKPNKLICRALKLAEGTVKTHTAAIYRALRVENRTQAVFALERLGLSLSALLARPLTIVDGPDGSADAVFGAADGGGGRPLASAVN